MSKQAVGNVMELGVPFFKGYLKKQMEHGFEGKPWKRDACLEQERICTRVQWVTLDVQMCDNVSILFKTNCGNVLFVLEPKFHGPTESASQFYLSLDLLCDVLV